MMLFEYWRDPIDFLTTSKMTKKWSFSRRCVIKRCTEGHVEGAILRGNTWLNPENAKKLEDPRRERRRDNKHE